MSVWMTLPAAWRALREALGVWGAARLTGRLAWRAVVTRPFSGLPPAAGPAERFTRDQLAPVLLLDDLLAGRPDGRALVARVVADAGAAFIAWNLAREPDVERLVSRFGNAELTRVEAPGSDLAFDVTRCHFVDLCRRLGRPELARVFCAADSVYFSRPDAPATLERPETLAGGDARCAFRFTRRVR